MKLTITVEDKTYQIQFDRIEHSSELSGYDTHIYGTSDGVNLFKIRGAERATIYKSNDSYLASGISFCSRKERWNGEKGRKEAVKKALLAAKGSFTKAQRHEFWDAYRRLDDEEYRLQCAAAEKERPMCAPDSTPADRAMTGYLDDIRDSASA